MLPRRIWPILIINILAVLGFSIWFIVQKNWEFIFYIIVMLFFITLIAVTYKRVNYPLPVLWGLTLWGLMHMAGGSIIVNGEVLYKLMLIPIVGEPYMIFKYDQLVHIIGFGVATLVMYYLLEPLLKKGHKRWVALSIVIVMAGLGVGALNEIIEFFATVISPSNGVGGYENTSLDLVSDLVGALLAIVWIRWSERRKKK